MFARSWKRLKDRRRRREWRRESMRAMGIPSFGRILQRETDDSLANPSSISDGADGKESPCMQETRVQSLGQEDPLEKGMASHFSIFACHGQRSLVGYSPQGRKESETAERLTHTHTHALSHTDTHTQHTDTHTHTRPITHRHTHTHALSAKGFGPYSFPGQKLLLATQNWEKLSHNRDSFYVPVFTRSHVNNNVAGITNKTP